MCSEGLLTPQISLVKCHFEPSLYGRYNTCCFRRELKCKGRTPPAHGRLDCQEDLNTQKVSCRMSCDPGYDVEYLAAMRYVCNPDGTWTPEPSSADSHWPNCKIYSRGEPVP
ncbi:hypothetical protein ACROYT_G002670 [Oculina patagonica]